MADATQRITDLLSAPMEQVIIALGKGIAQAQRELDRSAIDTQREIDGDPVLSEHGVQASFYQIPRAELELTMAIALEEDPQPRPATPPSPARTPTRAIALKTIHLQPVNATYSNQFNFDVNASSKLKLTIVPVPPAGAPTAVTPRLSEDEVRRIAQLADVSDARVAINFNGQARLWFVLQHRLEDDAVKRLALITIDDDTGRVVKSEKGG